MSRHALATGGWFDTAAANAYEETRRVEDGKSISLATGSEHQHETLYRTKGGTWVLHHWPSWRDQPEHWTQISPVQAASWMILNELPIPAELHEAMYSRPNGGNGNGTLH